MPVVDASVLVEYLVDGDGAKAAAGRLQAKHYELWAPHLVDAEVGHALRGFALSRRLDEGAAAAALWELEELPVRRVDHDLLVRAAWKLRDNVSFYDALYVALAELVEQPLLTFDSRLARASGLPAEVELLEA